MDSTLTTCWYISSYHHAPIGSNKNTPAHFMSTPTYTRVVFLMKLLIQHSSYFCSQIDLSSCHINLSVFSLWWNYILNAWFVFENSHLKILVTGIKAWHYLKNSCKKTDLPRLENFSIFTFWWNYILVLKGIFRVLKASS